MSSRDKRRLVIVENRDDVRSMLRESLSATGDFHVRAYPDAASFMKDLYGEGPRLTERTPDVALVDLVLQGSGEALNRLNFSLSFEAETDPSRMQGWDLVAYLADRKLPTQAIAMTAELTPKELSQVVLLGAAWSLTKPFTSIAPRTHDIIKRCAEYGSRLKNRSSSSPPTPSGIAASRLRRPVFLSYAESNHRLARGFKAHLEMRDIPVWWSPDEISIGQQWRTAIENAIDNVVVFVALITQEYMKSPNCMGELRRFAHRIESEGRERLKLCPVVFESNTANSAATISTGALEEIQWIDLSPPEFADRFTVLSDEIHWHQNRFFS